MKRCIGRIYGDQGPRCTNEVPHDEGTDYCEACSREEDGQFVDLTHYEAWEEYDAVSSVVRLSLESLLDALDQLKPEMRAAKLNTGALSCFIEEAKEALRATT